ncbi:MAG: hypothetical protein H0V07_12795 [Propionibacteriales bacterium]|nr:hypothetical protein [Propionibacteriales bacterium]
MSPFITTETVRGSSEPGLVDPVAGSVVDPGVGSGVVSPPGGVADCVPLDRLGALSPPLGVGSARSSLVDVHATSVAVNTVAMSMWRDL